MGKKCTEEGHTCRQRKVLPENFDFDVVIAGSGMGDFGAIRDIIKNYISDESNTVLLTGYVSPNSLCGN